VGKHEDNQEQEPKSEGKQEERPAPVPVEEKGFIGKHRKVGK
jgi:hypothetical protein